MTKREGGKRVARGRGRVPRRAGSAEPEVSIVTVVRNARELLPGAIESVHAQDYPTIEHVVVDGASDDGTVELLERLGDRLDYWCSEPDEGIADAFNKGIGLTTGEIVGILNADDRYEEGAVRRVVEAFESHPEVDLVCGALRFHDGMGTSWIASSDPRGLDRGMTILHPTTFVRRSRYERSGRFRTDYECAMDYELLLRFREDGALFLALPEVLASMQIGGEADRRWLRAIWEVARAQRSAGRPLPWVALGWVRRIVDHGLRRVLARLGMPGGWRSPVRRRLSSATAERGRRDGPARPSSETEGAGER